MGFGLEGWKRTVAALADEENRLREVRRRLFEEARRFETRARPGARAAEASEASEAAAMEQRAAQTNRSQRQQQQQPPPPSQPAKAQEAEVEVAKAKAEVEEEAEEESEEAQLRRAIAALVASEDYARAAELQRQLKALTAGGGPTAAAATATAAEEGEEEVAAEEAQAASPSSSSPDSTRLEDAPTWLRDASVILDRTRDGDMDQLEARDEEDEPSLPPEPTLREGKEEGAPAPAQDEAAPDPYDEAAWISEDLTPPALM